VLYHYIYVYLLYYNILIVNCIIFAQEMMYYFMI